MSRVLLRAKRGQMIYGPALNNKSREERKGGLLDLPTLASP